MTAQSINLCCSISDCIINENHDYLLEFLKGLEVAERSVQIHDWDTAGRVFLDYINVNRTLQAIQVWGSSETDIFNLLAFK